MEETLLKLSSDNSESLMIGSPAIDFVKSLLGDDHLLPGDDWFAINAADQILLLSFTGIDGIVHDILERLDVLIAEGACIGFVWIGNIADDFGDVAVDRPEGCCCHE